MHAQFDTYIKKLVEIIESFKIRVEAKEKHKSLNEVIEHFRDPQR